MQTLQQIRAMLSGAGLSPQKQFGQCFMIDQNLMRKVLELAEVGPADAVLEVGPGTGSLSEELLERAGRLVAVEIDHGLAALLREHLGSRPNFTLVEADVLAGKHAINPVVLEALAAPSGWAPQRAGPAGAAQPTEGQRLPPSADAAAVGAQLVSNLPYNIATPLLVECLLCSWRARRHLATLAAHPPKAGSDQDTLPGSAAVALPAPSSPPAPLVLFERLTFTVQREVADRLIAGPGSKEYGPVSVLAGLLGRLQAGAVLPGSAFWPAPSVASRMMRIDFDAEAADRIGRADVLMDLLTLSFGSGASRSVRWPAARDWPGRGRWSSRCWTRRAWTARCGLSRSARASSC